MEFACFLLVLITVGWLPVMNILRHGQLDERFILLFSSTGHWEFSIQCGLFSEHGFTECQKGERLQMFQPPDLLEMSDGKTNNVIFFFPVWSQRPALTFLSDHSLSRHQLRLSYSG